MMTFTTSIDKQPSTDMSPAFHTSVTWKLYIAVQWPRTTSSSATCSQSNQSGRWAEGKRL